MLDYEGKGDVATIARGIRFAARHGAKVLNMSFEFDIGLTAAQIPDVIAALKDMIAASPVPVVFDHFGGAQAAGVYTSRLCG